MRELSTRCMGCPWGLQAEASPQEMVNHTRFTWARTHEGLSRAPAGNG